MASSRFLALLRGINVGGNHIVKMADLKTVFERMGYTHVRTYIQSGNVIFTSTERNIESITSKLERSLAKQFNFPIPVIVISDTQLQTVVKRAPQGFGTQPELFRYDVIFLKPPITVKEAIIQIPAKEGVDTVHAGKDVLYFSRLAEKATQSKLPKLISLPIYKHMTIRNWNTTTTLLELTTSSA